MAIGTRIEIRESEFQERLFAALTGGDVLLAGLPRWSVRRASTRGVHDQVERSRWYSRLLHLLERTSASALCFGFFVSVA